MHKIGTNHKPRRLVSFAYKAGLVSLVLVVALSAVGWVAMARPLAATSPSLGLASTFGILASTYTNTAPGTVINGDLGYTTGPATAPTLNGTLYTPLLNPPTYSQAGIDQGTALAALNVQACTHTFPAGAVDLATDTSHGTLGIYTPGVYCTTATSAASIGTAGITLSGSGTYIFRVNGALTTVANSEVRFSGGASACNANVWWTPSEATTLGANSTFIGTVIDASGITVLTTVTWTGRALAFGGTVTATGLTVTVPTCLTVTKTVINDNGGTRIASNFTMNVTGTNVSTPSFPGAEAPGTTVTLDVGSYNVDEGVVSGYAKTLSAGCSGTIAAGESRTLHHYQQ
jgi:hypothetical protein